MQLAECYAAAVAKRAARMVIRQHALTVRVQRHFEDFENVFNVTFQIEEIDFTFRLVDVLSAHRTSERQNQ